MPGHYRQWYYAEPLGEGGLGPGTFAQRELPLPDPGPGEALVRVLLINIHSATKTRIQSGATRLGETDRSNYACAQVIRSRDPAFAEGDLIACQAGWQEYQIIRSTDTAVGYPEPSAAVMALNRTRSQWTYSFRPQMAAEFSPSVLMDVFGTSGMTAWFGLRQCGPVTPQDVVAVGGTTGSVGAIVAQLAKAAGARVIGFARNAERCHWVVDSLGADLCLDYTVSDLDRQLAQSAPNGITLFSDGVGGEFTERMMAAMATGGRLFAYGSSAAYYGAAGTQGARSLREVFGISPHVEQMLTARDIRSEAWIVDAFYQERLAAEDALAAMLRSGVLKPVTRVVRGFDALPQAICDLYGTPHAGKLQIDFS